MSCEHCQQVAIDRHARLIAEELASWRSIERDRLREELAVEAEEQLLAILLERIAAERLTHS